MLPRFFVPDLDPTTPSVVLPPREAHHLARVLRLRVGDDVAIFDGRGAEFRGQIAAIGRESATISLIEPIPAERSPAIALTLVQSIIKGEAMDGLVSTATMIGIHTLQPVFTHRTTVKRTILERAVRRWERLAIASAKQCGRARLPEIGQPRAFEDWLGTAELGDAYLLVEPSFGTSGVVTLRDLARRETPRTAALIAGPEGGWTREEHGLAVQAGCTPLTLGQLTLRADVAPIVAAGALLALWGEGTSA